MATEAVTAQVLPAEIREGWAIHPIRNDAVHFFTRGAPGDDDGNMAYSSCGMRTAEAGPFRLLEPGAGRRCLRCQEYRGSR